MSLMQKKRAFMCRVHLVLECWPFFSIRIELVLSWRNTVLSIGSPSCASSPDHLRGCVVHTHDLGFGRAPGNQFLFG
jgi:hypothetical protein